MSIRIRTVNGVRVALCAVESDEKSGDLYLDDADHYALAAKFASDWQGQLVDWEYPDEWAAMGTQKVRDAEEEIRKWAERERAEADDPGPPHLTRGTPEGGSPCVTES